MATRVWLALCIFTLTLGAQTTTTRRSTVRATADTTISATPDQALISVGVETRAATAQEAAAQNAVQTQAVLDALRKQLGANAEIKTTNYTVSPLYNYPPNASPVLTGYMVTNTVEVTLSNIASAGPVIDAATQAGANQINSLTFTLKDPEPIRAQALRQAAVKARGHAEAMISGLSGHLGTLISVEEGGTARIYPAISTNGAGDAKSTPIQPGSVQVYASVTVEYEIVQ